MQATDNNQKDERREFYIDGIKELSAQIQNTEYLESIYYHVRAAWMKDAEERN